MGCMQAPFPRCLCYRPVTREAPAWSFLLTSLSSSYDFADVEDAIACWLVSIVLALRLCTVTKEEEKTRNVNVYLLINSIACNELTTACRVWYLKSLKACTLFISYWLICQETRNEVEVNAPRLSVLGLFGFRKMTYTPRRRDYNGEE